jgi:hypothetical protein
MKAAQLIKKLGALLGKKEPQPPEQPDRKVVRVLDLLGAIQLHPNWRN